MFFFLSIIDIKTSVLISVRYHSRSILVRARKYLGHSIQVEWFHMVSAQS